ncbi:DUF7927 domain-containing protein [Streptomyces lateritius]|uniref:DUF7927 domain-containing protein n=1 Tax=Streptomyces lateritius TaxID=67313 RepID=UPI001E353F99|nr:DUF11 domain-containing protein [Streptomyces lateritius]
MHRLGSLSAALCLVAGLAVGTHSLMVAGPAAADVVEPFGKRYEESLYGDFRTVGNTVMGCPTAPADLAARCATAAAGRGGDNNNTFVLERLNTASMADGYGSSTGRVEIPAGARVAYARLFWGGNDGTYKGPSGVRLKRCDLSGGDVRPSPGDYATTAPRIRVGAGPETPVSLDSMVADPADTDGPHYYTGESDVTAAFAGVTGGTDTRIAVGNIWAAAGKGCVAGWSLTVVHAFPGPEPTHAPERRNVYVYGGHVLQRSTSPATTITVDGFHRTAGTVRASVTAYEGDRNTPGDTFLVGGEKVAEAHTGSTGNFFTGDDDGAVSPRLVDNLSIDARAFDVPDRAIPVGARSAGLTFSTSGDTYVPAALALSVPVPDLEITKTAHPKKAKPGDTLTYTITAKNTGKLDHRNAELSDDLTGTLDDGTYNGDAKATLGTVTYKGPKIGYVGDIPAGGTAKITYSVTVDDPVRGDGKLVNGVVVESPRSNCGRGSEDPACGAAPVIDPPERKPTRTPPPTPTATPTVPSPSPDPVEFSAFPTPVPDATTQQPRPVPHGPGGSMAETGSHGERLWLLGGLALALAATGVVAKAAMRGRRES